MKLGDHLRSARDSGRKLLVPYVTGGFGEDWCDVVRACAAAGADAVEVGIPFSDPVMDGPVIQQASEQALRSGATPPGVIAALGTLDIDIPIVVMSYGNPIFRMGARRSASMLAEHGVSGVILPDVPPEELAPWWEAARPLGVETVLLVSPMTPDDRMRTIAESAEGFLYCISLLGVTGERASLGTSAARIAERARTVSDLPALLGIGISTPDQAREAAEVADGVIVGSALVRRMIDGEGPLGVERFVAELRAGLDRA
ncbi:MAG: tryptophan synthase subunit alpha [Acidimicrobiia bacterium]